MLGYDLNDKLGSNEKLDALRSLSTMSMLMGFCRVEYSLAMVEMIDGRVALPFLAFFSALKSQGMALVRMDRHVVETDVFIFLMCLMLMWAKQDFVRGLFAALLEHQELASTPFNDQELHMTCVLLYLALPTHTGPRQWADRCSLI